MAFPSLRINLPGMAQKDQAVAPKEGTSSVLPPGVSASGRVVGDYYIPAVGEEESRPKQRGYTTRAKEEARRTEVKFTGLVRRWEKRWVNVGHLKVPHVHPCLLYTSPSPRDGLLSRMPSSA